MSEQYSPQNIYFEQKHAVGTANELAHEVTDTSLKLASFAIRLANIERVPRYNSERRENDAEHSYMLTLIAPALAASCYPKYDAGLISELCTVHELTELITGDIATFDISESDLAQKAMDEDEAIDALCEQLPLHTAYMLRLYHDQEIPEARFVRFIDKLLPVLVDILGEGKQVMQEDYGMHTPEQFLSKQFELKSRFEAMFPEREFEPIHIARNSLALLFSKSLE